MLTGRRLRWARIAWILLAAVIWGMTLGGLTEIPRQAASISPDIQQLMRDTGLPATFPALYNVATDLLMMTAFSVVAVIVFIRRGDDFMALFVSAMMLLTAHIYNGTKYDAGPLLYVAAFLMGLGETAQVTFFYLFPSGQFIPRWFKYLIPFILIFRVAIWTNIYLNDVGQQALEVGIVVLLMLIGIGLQVYRYRKHSTALQRQQLKWVLIGVLFTVLIVATYIYIVNITQAFGEQNASNYFVLAGLKLVRQLALFIFPFTITLSILRYRLWDIDLAINRTLVGALIAVMLAIPFVAVVIVLQRVLGTFLVENEARIAIAIATVIAGLLFDPARRQAQKFIDRRLYHFRFDLNELNRGQKPVEIKHSGYYSEQTLGGYHVLDLLGRGGMGEVYKAEKDGRIYALKVLPTDLAKQEAHRSRFLREVEATGTLSHPNIVHVHDSGESNGVLYMVMDYIEAADLKTMLHERGRLSLTEAVSLLQPLAEALDYAHSRGYVHRDIKPANIMIPSAGEETFKPILMDFGLAKLEDAQSNITGTGAVGTIDYMAPEQIHEAQAVDARADVYALGVVLYEILAGERPFKGTAAQVLFAHLQQPPPDLDARFPDLPRHVTRAVKRAMAKTPSARFQSAGELVSALRAA